MGAGYGARPLPTALALAVAVTFAPGASRAQNPAAEATPPPAAISPLRVIGTVHATTPYCRAQLDHALAAIDRELQGDLRLAFVEQALRTTKYDDSIVARNNGSERLDEAYVALRIDARTGATEMTAFLKAAKDAPTPEMAASMTAFADALRGALVRQQHLADRIASFVGYLDTHAPITEVEHEQMVDATIDSQSYNFQAAAHQGVRPYAGPVSDTDPTKNVPPRLTTAAKETADDLTERATPLGHDEADAADRIETAFSGC